MTLKLAVVTLVIVAAAIWYRWIRLSAELADGHWEPWRDTRTDRLQREHDLLVALRSGA